MSVKPKSDKTSLLCSPFSGGLCFKELGERDRLNGCPTSSVLPNGIVSIDCAMPRCLTWGSSKTLSIELIGPQGTPTFSNFSTHSFELFLTVTSSIRSFK